MATTLNRDKGINRFREEAKTGGECPSPMVKDSSPSPCRARSEPGDDRLRASLRCTPSPDDIEHCLRHSTSPRESHQQSGLGDRLRACSTGASGPSGVKIALAKNQRANSDGSHPPRRFRALFSRSKSAASPPSTPTTATASSCSLASVSSSTASSSHAACRAELSWSAETLQGFASSLETNHNETQTFVAVKGDQRCLSLDEATAYAAQDSHIFSSASPSTSHVLRSSSSASHVAPPIASPIEDVNSR